MTDDRIAAIYEEIEKNDPGKLAKEDLLHPNRTISGFLKLASLLDCPAALDLCADHDVIYLSGELRLDITKEDIVYLFQCGIYHDDDGFYCFV